MQLLLGFSLSLIISLLAWRVGALSNDGAVTATITGGLIFGLGGLSWAAVLLTFFISSSALSKMFSQRKKSLRGKFAKDQQRDWGQVLANDGLGTILALMLVVAAEQTWLWAAYAGAMATVNADTWATELGVLSKKSPRLITTGKMVDPGTSGGISWLGTLATLGGAVLIGAVGAAPLPRGGILPLILAASLGGVCGSLFDSWLGATVQAIYHCPSCQKETERHPVHSCGVPTGHLRGWRWLDNDMVNFLASVVGALVALGVWWGGQAV